MSQTALAAASGVSLSNLNKFLNGNSDLSPKNFVSVLKALGVDLDSQITQLINAKMTTREQPLELNDCISNLDEFSKEQFGKTVVNFFKLNSSLTPKNLQSIEASIQRCE